ncbi:MAG: M56 family metallopeptidase [Paludibaculum sp.]
MYLAQYSSRLVMELLASASLRILILAAWAALLAWSLRRRGPDTRHAVWVGVLCAMLLMPALTVVLPPHRVVPPSWLVAPPRVPFESALRMQSRTVMTVTASGKTTVNESAVPVRRPVLPNWPSLLMAGYGLIAALAALRVAQAVRRAARLVSESEEIRDERLTELLRLICLEQGTGYPLPAVRQSNSTQVPFTAGWQAPAILLPPDWREWDAFKLKAVLAHEMAHIRRGDWLIALLAAVNRTVFWIHPLAWWLERRLADLAEEACDTAAIGPQGTPGAMRVSCWSLR